MATKNSRPGRTLAVFLAVIAIMFVSAAAIGDWKPKLGLDLQGGTRITLQARSEGGGAVTKQKLEEAVGIISSRVNGAGVAEAEVTTQGSDIIVVEVPGAGSEDLARTLGSTAQLRFRLVALFQPPPVPQPTASTAPTSAAGTASQSPSPSTPNEATDSAAPSTPGGTPESPAPPTTADPTDTAPTVKPGNTTSKNRVASGWLSDKKSPAAADKTTPAAGKTTAAPTDKTTPGGTTTPTPTAPTSTTPTAPAPTVLTPTPPTAPPTTGGPPTALVPPDLEDIPDPLNWQPTQEWQAKFIAFRCPKNGAVSLQEDIPSQPLLACDDTGSKFLLGPAMIEGTELDDASAQLPTTGTSWVVNLDFNGAASKTFATITNAIANQTNPLTGQQKQFAIVLDKKVISAPVVNSPINNGQATIEGSRTDPFTQESSSSLANSLKYGALPLSFDTAQITTEGPELASNQLHAGVVAGIVGLLLVVLYCLLYYRGLGFVVIASLLIAGLLTYASVLLLGRAYGFTLTLPGIAGLIVAVGITADSFIVYFERLRDEVRDGKTLRTSVETGWVRARTTILAADAVSMLAALVLFIFAIGVVKGFAFALGLTTFIDVFVVFFFTKPVVTLLSRTKFFGQGHKWSGLDRQHLGMPPLKTRVRAAGGEA